MDFYGILFDMKNGSKMPYSKNYFDTLFAAKLNDPGIKTLTGTLPLTFRTSETALRSWIVYGNDFQQEESKSTRLPLSIYTDEDKLRDWTIYGNNTQHNYSAEGTLPLTFTTHTAGAADDWVIYGNDDNGTENLFDKDAKDTANGYVLNEYLRSDGSFIHSTNYYISEYIPTQANETYTFTAEESANTPCICFYDAQKNVISGESYAGRSSFTITSPVDTVYARLSIRNNYAGSIMLTKGSTAPDHYIPYQKGVGEQRQDGYYVPLTVSQTGQPDKTVDIYIGDSPLTEGETVSKTSTGVDIELFEGENTITTDLYNKPSMSIEGVDYVGVGEYVNGQWQIPLTVSDGTNTTTVNIPIDAPLTASDTATKASTGVDIATADGTNTIGTTLENKPTMLVYYGYKGAGEHSGNTWEFNFITSANGNQQLTKITMNKPLRAGETLTSEQAGVTIPTYADAENTLSLYPSAAGYGNPEMSITYKGG